MRYLRLVCVCLLFVGCVTTHTVDVKTGMFNDNLAKLTEAYKAVDALGNGKIEAGEMEQLGFNFTARNVERLSGATVFRRIFGDAVFQNAMRSPQDAGALLTEMNRYYAFSIPFRNIITKDDRFFFSRKDTISRGDDMLILFVFHREGERDVLVLHDFTYVHVDSHESYSAFAKGLLDVLEQYGGAASGVSDTLQKLKDLLNKN